jgi:hypothetical protein
MNSSIVNLWANRSLSAAVDSAWPTANPELRAYAAEQVINQVTGGNHQANKELLKNISQVERDLESVLRVYWRSI